ncbi:putative RNA-directed DNA polymerase [Helianthus anomalus]
MYLHWLLHFQISLQMSRHLYHRLYHSRHVQFVPHIFPTRNPHANPTFPLPIDDFLDYSPPSPLSTDPTLTPQPTQSPLFMPPTPTNIHTTPSSPAHISTQPDHIFTQPNQPLIPAPTRHPNDTNQPPTTPVVHPTNPTSPHPTSLHIDPIHTPSPTSVTHHNINSPAPSTPTPSTPTANLSPPSNPTPPPRTRKPNPKYYGTNFVNHTTIHPIPSTLEPTCVSQAFKDPLWRKAMDDEYNALLHNHTWELVPPSSHQPIGCKWVFRVKRKTDGSIDKYKARLLAKGFHQQLGKDFFETFSPVTKPVTIRVVLSLALSHNWPLRQLDVNNAFLQGTLHEDVYMIQPPGYKNEQFPNHVCKLRKSLYGLKQAPRAWYLELKTFLLHYGFKKSHSDASLFIYNQKGKIMYFLVYVDDIVLTGNCTSFIDTFVTLLSQRFSLKDLGELHHFLGIEVIPTNHGIFLSQHRHINDLLTNFHMDGAKDVVTPLSSSEPLYPDDGSSRIDPTTYRKIIGSLQYLAFTRPDFCFAVNKLSQYMHAPTTKHMQALKRVMRYLKGTIHYGLFLNRRQPISITAFADSDWGTVHLGLSHISWVKHCLLEVN